MVMATKDVEDAAVMLWLLLLRLLPEVLAVFIVAMDRSSSGCGPILIFERAFVSASPLLLASPVAGREIRAMALSFALALSVMARM